MVGLRRRRPRRIVIVASKEKDGTPSPIKGDNKKRKKPKTTTRSKKKNKKDCPLTIDGWANFLQGQIERLYTIKLALVAIAFSVIAIIISVSVAYFSDESFVYAIVATVLFTGLTLKVARDMTRNSEIAQKVLDEIFKGDLTESNSIRDEWLSKRMKD